MQQTEQRNTDQCPSEHQPERAVRATSFDEGDSSGDQHERHGKTPETRKPTNDRFDAAAERAGEIDIDGERGEHPGADQSEAKELVLTTIDSATQFGSGAIAARQLRRGLVAD